MFVFLYLFAKSWYTFQDRRKRKREKTSRHKRKHKSHKDRIKQSEDDRVKQLVEDDTENNKEVTCVSKNDVIMTDISSERCDNDGSCDSHGHSSRTVDRTCDIGEQPTDNCDIRRETNDTSIGEDCKMVTSLSSMDGGDDVEQSELEDGEISDSSTSSSSSCSYSESASSPDDSAHLASLPDAVDDGTTRLLLQYLCHRWNGVMYLEGWGPRHLTFSLPTMILSHLSHRTFYPCTFKISQNDLFSSAQQISHRMIYLPLPNKYLTE